MCAYEYGGICLVHLGTTITQAEAINSPQALTILPLWHRLCLPELELMRSCLVLPIPADSAAKLAKPIKLEASYMLAVWSGTFCFFFIPLYLFPDFFILSLVKQLVICVGSLSRLEWENCHHPGSAQALVQHLASSSDICPCTIASFLPGNSFYTATIFWLC